MASCMLETVSSAMVKAVSASKGDAGKQVERVPDDVKYKIFAKLDAKTLASWRAVCKEWRQLLSLSGIHIYRSETGQWKALSSEKFVEQRGDWDDGNGVYSEGYFFWIVNEEMIMTFSLDQECFDTIALPDHTGRGIKTVHRQMIEYNSSEAFLQFYTKDKKEVKYPAPYDHEGVEVMGRKLEKRKERHRLLTWHRPAVCSSFSKFSFGIDKSGWSLWADARINPKYVRILDSEEKVVHTIPISDLLTLDSSSSLVGIDNIRSYLNIPSDSYTKYIRIHDVFALEKNHLWENVLA